MMPILRHKHQTSFTIVPNATIKDTRLSLRDVGLLCYMLSLPDDWQFSISGFAAILPHDGRDAIANSLKNIEQAGFLRRVRERSATGQIDGVVWYVSDIPLVDSPQPEKPYTAEPYTAEPYTVNPSQTKKLLNKETTNKEKNGVAPQPENPFMGELGEAFGDWLNYKRERRQGYTVTGLKSLITQTRKAAEQYGEHAVAEIITTSMASGYQGIVFDRLAKGGNNVGRNGTDHRADSEKGSTGDSGGSAESRFHIEYAVDGKKSGMA